MQLEPIGFLQSCFPDKFGTPRQPGLVPGTRSRLKLRADLQPELALQGLEGFSHVWLVFLFHKNESSRYHAKVRPPRLDGKPMGLFATRTPHRPNPIGLSLVELVKIEGDTLVLEGADLIEGTPILDIKPYLPEVESRPDARTGWTCGAKEKEIQVEFSSEAAATLAEWQSASPREDLQRQITNLIQLDPRPLVYRGFEGQAGPYRQEHRMRFYDGDIHFEFTTENFARVQKIHWPL